MSKTNINKLVAVFGELEEGEWWINSPISSQEDMAPTTVNCKHNTCGWCGETCGDCTEEKCHHKLQERPGVI